MTGSPVLQTRPRGSGTAVIRLAGPADRAKITAFIKGLPPETLYRRFHAMAAPGKSSMPYLCGEKGTTILVAEADGAIVGHVMTAPVGGSATEIAFVVHDAWQRRGIATRLTESAAALASECGMTTLIGYIQDGNQDAVRLLRRLSSDMRLAREGRGTLRADIPLPLVPPGRLLSAAASVTSEKVRPAYAEAPGRPQAGMPAHVIDG